MNELILFLRDNGLAIISNTFISLILMIILLVAVFLYYKKKGMFK